jgi:hypothetical protein
MPTVSQKHTGDVLRKWRLVLSHADILTLQSVPVAFVPAPSNANNAYRVLGASIQAQLNSGAPYTGNAATVVLNFNAGNSTGPLLCNTVNLNTVIASNAANWLATGEPAAVTANIALFAGQGITVALINGGSNLTAGNANNSLVVELLVDEFDASLQTV